MLCFKMMCVILNLMRTAIEVENTTMIKTERSNLVRMTSFWYNQIKSLWEQKQTKDLNGINKIGYENLCMRGGSKV